MTGGVEDGDASVTEVAPDDDVGADTLDRFVYQAHLVAGRCAGLLLDDSVKAIVCEWHEDYLVQFANGPSEVVSVKHHDGDQRHWTIRDLCSDGGIKHLFGRYERFQENVTCRLQTNEQLRTGPPAEFKAVCMGDDPRHRGRWAQRLVQHLGSQDVELIGRFLDGLRIEDGLPDRRTLASVNRDQLMPLLAAKLGLPLSEHRACYQRLVDLALEASRSPGRALVIEALTDPAALDLSNEHVRVLAAKTLDHERVLSAIGRPDTVPAILLSSAAPSATERTNLTKKLEVGGVGPTGINSARRLRANWTRHVSAWSTGLPGDEAQIEHLKAVVLQLAGVAEGRHRQPGGQYAVKMIEELRQLLAEHDFASPGPMPLTVDLLLGLAYELTEECEIYWSDKFDTAVMP